MSKHDEDDEITIWSVLTAFGKAAGKTVEVLSDSTTAALGAANEGQKVVRNTMAITEITTIWNTTNKNIRFINRETPRDTRDILGENAVSMKTENTAGAWIPWYDPPRFADFERRHLEVVIDDVPVVYIWQRGDYVFWTNRLDSEGNPAKAYKMTGVSHIGGKRTLVVRYDPATGYSVFLANPEMR